MLCPNTKDLPFCWSEALSDKAASLNKAMRPSGWKSLWKIAFPPGCAKGKGTSPHERYFNMHIWVHRAFRDGCRAANTGSWVEWCISASEVTHLASVPSGAIIISFPILPLAQIFPLHWQMLLSGPTESFILFHPREFSDAQVIPLPEPCNNMRKSFPRSHPSCENHHKSSYTAMGWLVHIHTKGRSSFHPLHSFLWWPLLIPHRLMLKLSLLKRSFYCPCCPQEVIFVVL